MPSKSTNNIQLILQRPSFDTIIAGGLILLVAAMSIAWVGVIHRVNLRKACLATFAVLVIVLLNVVGDQLEIFSRLDLVPPPFVMLVLATLGFSVLIGMGWMGSMRDDHFGPFFRSQTWVRL